MLVKFYKILITVVVLSLSVSCSKVNNNLELAVFNNGAVQYEDYLEHFLLSTKYKPDEFPTESNLKDIVELKAIEKMALKEALSESIDKDSSYISIVENNSRRLLYQKYIGTRFTKSIITDSLIQKFYKDYSPQYHMKYIMRPIVKTSDDKFI